MFSPDVAPPDSPPAAERPASPAGGFRRRRSFLPRFGLRSLFVFAVLFCLFFGWAGKHLYRMRQEQAAVEALKQADAKFSVMGGGVGPWIGWVEAKPFEDYDSLGRLFGWTARPALSLVELASVQADDRKAAEAIEALALFPEIDHVQLQGPAFDDASLLHLTSLTRLEEVSLLGTDVTGAGLVRLDQSAPIQSVFLGNDELTEELIDGIASLSELEWLGLVDNEPIEPRAYAPLAKARGLTSLIAEDSGFDDDDMTTLAKLERLDLWSVDGITDVGAMRLDPLTKLTRLVLHHPVAAETARKFSASHPNCRVGYVDDAMHRTEFLAGKIVP